jgi:transposase
MANASQTAGLGLAAALADISCEGRGPSEGCLRAEEVPPEFKRDVVDVARRGDLSVNEVAADFDVAPETVRRRMRQADVDDGVKDGLTSREQSEVVQLRRTSRSLETENEILRQAAHPAKDALPK